MTKVNLKDATKELLKNAEDVLGSVSSLRKKANTLMNTMKSVEAKYQKEEEQQRAEEKKAEQQRLISRQTKAYTMPDTDDLPATEEMESKPDQGVKAEASAKPASDKLASAQTQPAAEKLTAAQAPSANAKGAQAQPATAKAEAAQAPSAEAKGTQAQTAAAKAEAVQAPSAEAKGAQAQPATAKAEVAQARSAVQAPSTEAKGIQAQIAAAKAEAAQARPAAEKSAASADSVPSALAKEKSEEAGSSKSEMKPQEKESSKSVQNRQQVEDNHSMKENGAVKEAKAEKAEAAKQEGKAEAKPQEKATEAQKPSADAKSPAQSNASAAKQPVQQVKPAGRPQGAQVARPQGQAGQGAKPAVQSGQPAQAAKPAVQSGQSAQAVKPAVQSGQPVQAVKPAVQNGQSAQVVRPAGDVAPRTASATAQNARPVAAQQGQAARPVNAQQGQMARPVNAQQGQVARPVNGQQGSYGRPANGQQGQYGRPANGQQGQYGRPANGQQGPYGRPANGQQGSYGRPANGQQGQQGQYGRPANGQPGQYGRPANGQPGQYGRPANGQPGQYGRPANSQPGQYGRPANGQQGQYGRPAGGQQGQYGRPAGGAQGGNRPQGGNRVQSGAPRKSQMDLAPVVEKERVSNYDPNKKNYVRQHDPEHVAKNKKQLAKESFPSEYDDDVVRGRRNKGKKLSVQQMMAPIKIETAYMTAETISVKDLTERIGKPAGEILKKLMLLGTVANINSDLDYDTASLVCSDFGITLEMNLAKTAEDNLAETDFEDSEEELQPRPPVVTIMGHVDHGKTSLLDYIRKAKVTAGEAGGITQHIGAYTVNLDGRIITFLDTPGHEAFTAMRARGAQATDIAVLVVAADDGVMPQTIEAINHAKAAEVPIIVAINKMDKPTADPERVKQDLTKYELVCEEWGGDTIMVPVSAATGFGVDDLLEMILLQADMLQLRANPNRMAKGVIIEAKLDKSRGPLATVLLQNGTLHVGDNIVAGMASGHVRSMLNDKGERVKEAGPAMPVEISGFDEVPSAGDDMMAVEDDRLSRQVVQERKDKAKAVRNASTSKVSLDNLFSRIDASKMTTLNIIVKADVQGSVEAVKQALEKLSNDDVKVRVLHSAVGAITKDDVNLASAFDAIIVGFNIRPDSGAKDAAEHEGVDIRLYRVIYQAIEEIEKAMKGLLEPEYKEVMLGHAEVRNIFHITGAGTVAGCYVKDGKVQRNAQVRLIRDNVVVHEGKLSGLKRFKDDAKEVAEGYECGISFDNYNDIKEGDMIECFIMEEIER